MSTLAMFINVCGFAPPLIERSSKSCQDLAVQLDVFEEQRDNDEAQSQHPGVDLNSPLDVFYAILNRVADTPQEIPFLSILQHLLRIDPKEAVSDVVWDTAERLVHRATLLECREDASRLLRSPSQKQLPTLRKASLTPAPAPPPPPPAAPPPPPTAPPPPAAPPPAPARLSPEPQGQQPALKLLPQQETPTPKTKMKTINWNKIPNNKVVGKHNIWSMVARNHQGSPMADLDWSEMEGLFCQQAPTPAPASPRPSRDHSDTKRNQPTEIALLDGKRSLNVNIFLKQFRSSNEDIIQLIRNGEHDDIGAEKLRGLLKILPELDELEMLRNFDGDKTKLGNAEKFLLQLIEVPNYKLRIESMLLKEEFAANMSYLEPSINAMIVAGEDLMRNESLREVLYMVVVAGNFLNAGGYAGNAAGVKLSSLQKLTDIRANKPGMNLIHFVALQAEKKKKELLRFPDDMSIIEEATKTTVEQLQHEINALDARIKVIHKQIDLPTTEKEIKDQMADFLKMADQEVTGLQKDMEELESVRKSLAEFFCEDPGTFKVEECFKIFHGFCSKFKQAVVENDRRRQQEEQAAARRRQREEHLAKRRTLGQQSGNGSESEGNIVDSLLSDIRSGFQQKPTADPSRVKKVGSAMTSEEDISVMGSPALSRRRLGSFSCDQPPNREETYSPDVTPTGSLRRRRSRVPSEEDESTLMDFLRASGHDGSRERKSWGSLDRSWARRARGGGRKRPDLLSADFYGDRERPTSPLPTTPDEENKPKPWKQKIEAWLSENEKEDKQNEEIRRRPRRFQPNRRSLEADSESEGRSPLDTLPEGKLAEGNLQYKRVYSDWRPTIEKTDVVGAMEAIAEATPDSPVKDKSPWRKSNLNVPNTSEQTELDVRRLRRLKSRSALDSPSTSPPLQAINEEEKRKEVIRTLGESLAEVTLPVYMRRPSDQGERFKASPLPARKVEEEETNLPPFAPRRNRRPDVPDKVEIDSDNIETPPATRRVIPVQPPRCSRLKDEEVREEDEEEEGPLGEGRFDRFAASRRTLRYRKPVEEETPKQPELVPEKQVIKQETRQAQSTPVEKLSPKDKESRLKKWQEKLKSRFEQDPEEEAIADITKSREELRKLSSSSTLPRPTRRNTSVDTKEVLEAIGKQLKETTVEVEPSKPEAKKPNEPLNKIVSSSTLPRTFRRRTNIDQSDVTKAIRRFGSGRETEKTAQAQKANGKSNTPASPSTVSVQETSKSPSVKNEFIPEIKVQVNAPAKIRNEHELNDEGFEETQSLVSETPSQGASSGNYEGDSTDSPVKSKGGKLLRADSSGSGDTSSGVNTREVKRTSSMRAPGDKKSVIPRRSASMRKSDSQSTLIRQASDKRVPPSKTENTPAQRRILALANKQNSKPAVLKSDSNIILTPKATGVVKSALPKRFGSRSSLRSSGSSLNSGASVSTVRTTVPKRVAGTSVGRARPVSTSFKENTATTSSSGESIGPTKKGLHFMRPTAASAAKDTLDSTRLRATLRSIK